MFLRLVAKMSDRFLEQRINIKLSEKLEKNASDTCEMLSEAYGGESVKRTSVSEWNIWFKEGRKNVKDDERSGRNIKDVTEPMKMLKKLRIWCTQIEV